MIISHNRYDEQDAFVEGIFGTSKRLASDEYMGVWKITRGRPCVNGLIETFFKRKNVFGSRDAWARSQKTFKTQFHLL